MNVGKGSKATICRHDRQCMSSGGGKSAIAAAAVPATLDPSPSLRLLTEKELLAVSEIVLSITMKVRHLVCLVLLL